MKKITLGKQVLAEFYGCCVDTINDKSLIREAMVKSAEVAGATIVADVFHEFNPHGISGVVVIAESHIAIHSWPEHRCASVDIFTCSEDMDPHTAVEYLRTMLKAQRIEVQIISRGRVDAPAIEYASQFTNPNECELL